MYPHSATTIRCIQPPPWKPKRIQGSFATTGIEKARCPACFPPCRNGFFCQKEQSEFTWRMQGGKQDRKSTRLNSSHTVISYAVFCLKKKKNDEMHRIRD